MNKQSLRLGLKQKGLTPIVIILLIALVIGGYLLYSGKISLDQKTGIQTTTQSPFTDETASWKTFTTSGIDAGLTLKYPSNWVIVENAFIAEKSFVPGEQDRSKVYNIIGIQKYSTQLYVGYTNSEWFNKISNLTEPMSDQREIRTKIASGTITSGEPYVIFKDEPSATAKTEIFKQVKTYILKDQTIYQLTLDLYDNNGLETFKKIVATAAISSPTSDTNLKNWTYKTYADCSVEFLVPPKKDPYYDPQNNQGRFWDFPRGVISPNLLSKFPNKYGQYKQANAWFAAEGEASGQIAAAVSVSCIKNTNNINNQGMVDILKEGLDKYNKNDTYDPMTADKYTIQSSNEVIRWDKQVVDLTMSEYYQNSGGEPFTNTVEYTIFTTPKFIYEVRIFKSLAVNKDFINETAQKIFDNLKFQ